MTNQRSNDLFAGVELACATFFATRAYYETRDGATVVFLLGSLLFGLMALFYATQPVKEADR